jgi:hypothetical protein
LAEVECNNMLFFSTLRMILKKVLIIFLRKKVILTTVKRFRLLREGWRG